MDKKKRGLEILGVFGIFLAIFLLISLYSYSPSEVPAGSSTEITNWGGTVGAHVAYWLDWLLGLTGWIIIFLLAFLSIQLINQQAVTPTVGAVVGAIFVLLSLTGIFSLWREHEILWGGSLGDFLVDIFEPFLGHQGTFLAFVFFLIVGASLQTASSIISLFKQLWNLLCKLYELVEYVVISIGGIILLTGRYLGKLLKYLTAAAQNLFFQEPDPVADKPKKSAVSSPPKKTEFKPSKKVASAVEDDRADSSGSSTDRSTKKGPKAEQDQLPELTFGEAKQQDMKTEPQGADGSQPVEVNRDRPRVDDADLSNYRFPPLKLLAPGNVQSAIPDEETQREVAAKLENTFKEFGFEASVVGANAGPVLTMYEVEPGPGVSVSKFQNSSDDIKLNLAVQSIRIVSPIPGKSAVGIEVPNPDRALVKLRDVIDTPQFKNTEKNLPLAFGLDVFGDPLVVDLGKLPHVLVAGATGSGKSVCINSIICSLLYRLPPDELKFIMIDPKRVELKLYDGLPHLITEVIDDPDDANKALKWAVDDMERRYQTLSEAGCRDINSYNQQVDPEDKLPYLVIIVDELADLMFTNKKECELSITRIAQKARAVGIYLVLATQRPSTDVITGLIKANMPARIACRVSSGTDSRGVIDQNGAETLLGNGDLLYLSSASPYPRRAQGSFLDDRETKEIIKYVKNQLRPSYIDDEAIFGSDTLSQLDEDFDDEYYEEAKKLVITSGKASASMIQRRFRVGYNRAARMVDMMQEEGIVGPHRGSRARRVLVDAASYYKEDEAGEE